MGRWVVQDPVIHHDYSPYSAFDNNPVYWSDPSGADSQLYKDKNGNVVAGSFDGQDAQNLFNQYLNSSSKKSEEEVQKMYEFTTSEENDGNGGGGDGKSKDSRKYKSYNDYYQKVLRHKFLKNFTFEDAIYHYNFGKGESVTVNLNTLNFDDITVERFLKSEKRYQNHPSITVNFLGSDYKGDRKEQGLIYGNITLVYLGNNKIMALPDEYNFEIHKGNILTKRNILTFMGSLYNGAGNSYHIYFQGTAKIKTK